jgi:nickel-dependent lactate racemase
VLAPAAADFVSGRTATEIVRLGLQSPVAAPALRELASGRDNIVIITSDHTRPLPSRITVPLLLEEIRKGSPRARITLLIAAGMHRTTLPEELEQRFGRQVLDRVTVINHQAERSEDLVDLGMLPSGGELWINKTAAEADLLISEGFIEPHFFAGFSGGSKSVLPGIAGRETVLFNHNAEFIASPYARTGVLQNNPIQHDIVWAAKKAGLAFVLNVVLNDRKEIIRCLTGDPVEAHHQGCAFCRKLAAIPAQPVEIVITTNGGYPLDQNLYQAVKGMTAAEATANPGAVIIMAARCRDGLGGANFFHLLADYPSPQAALDRIMATPPGETGPDQWQSQILARILSRHKVIMVTDFSLADDVRCMHMDYASTLEEALGKARQEKGDGASCAVIPDGVSVIVE